MMLAAKNKGFLRDGVIQMFSVCDTPVKTINEIDRQLNKQKESEKKTEAADPNWISPNND